MTQVLKPEKGNGGKTRYAVQENANEVRSVCQTSNFSLEISALMSIGSKKVKNKWGSVRTCDNRHTISRPSGGAAP